MRDRDFYNPVMFKLARESRGLTHKELSDLSGVPLIIVMSLENKSVLIVNNDWIQMIATITKYPVDFFYQEGEEQKINHHFKEEQ
jgi:hypothetical protein